MLHLRKERALQLTDREGTRGRPVRTRGTKDSLMSEVTMVLFPTPSGRVPGHGHWLVVRGPRGGRPTHHRRREGSAHLCAWPRLRWQGGYYGRVVECVGEVEEMERDWTAAAAVTSAGTRRRKAHAPLGAAANARRLRPRLETRSYARRLSSDVPVRSHSAQSLTSISL